MTNPPGAYPIGSTLPRVIGVSGVAFSAFNCIVGVGIFGLPGLVAGVLGSSAIFAYVICLVLIGLIALCLAEAGSRVSDAGGVYAYASSAFGPVVGGVAGVLFLFASSIGSAAALARFFMDTLASVWPTLAQPILNFLALVFLYGGLALINILGTRNGNRLTITFGLLKFVPLALLIIVGAFAIEPANLTWTELPAIDRIADGALILFFAFMGVESGLNVSGETRNPERTIPRAIALALGTVHPRFATPAVAIALYATSVVAVAASGSFRQIAVLAVAGTLVLYLICCLGVLRLRAKNIAAAGSPFVAPGGPIVPIAAAAIILWLLSTLAMREMIATLSFLVVAALIYYARYAKMKSAGSGRS